MQTNWPISYTDVTSSSFHRQPCLTFRDSSVHKTIATPSLPTAKSTNVKQYSCVDCSYTTDRKNNLKRHRTTMHEQSGRTLECCGIIFTDKSTLRNHVTHEHGSGTGYACVQCGRRFGRRALMRRHVAVHDAHLQQQKQSSGVTDAKSNGNGQVVSTRSPPIPRLTTDPANGVHSRKMTSHQGAARRFECRVCEYSTSHKSNLERHLRRHIGAPATTRTVALRPSPSPRVGNPPGIKQLQAMTTEIQMIQSSSSMLDGENHMEVLDGGDMYKRIRGGRYLRASEQADRSRYVTPGYVSSSDRGHLSSSWPYHNFYPDSRFGATIFRKHFLAGLTPEGQLMSRRTGGGLLSTPAPEPMLPPLPSSILPCFDRLAATAATLNECRASLWPTDLRDITTVLQAFDRVRYHNRLHLFNNRSIDVSVFEKNQLQFPAPQGQQVHNKRSSSYRAHSTEMGENLFREKHYIGDTSHIISSEETKEMDVKKDQKDDGDESDVDQEEDGDIVVDSDDVSLDMWNLQPGSDGLIDSSQVDDGLAKPDAIDDDDHGDDVNQSKPRCRMLPLLHTCRTCSVTFASQLQLKVHVDSSHQSEEADARDAIRPITLRDDDEHQQQQQQQQQNGHA